MSTISEQVKELREKADYINQNGTTYPSVISMLNEASDIIETLSQKLNEKWITCNGKLEEEKFYIVTYRFNDETETKCHELYYGVSDYEDKPNWYLDDDCKKLYKPFTVIAWQPLPEAYHEKVNDTGDDNG